MTQQLLSWLFALGAAISKQAAIKASPVATGLLHEIAMSTFEIIAEEIDPQLSHDEKATLFTDSLNVAKTAWRVCEQEALLSVDDVAVLTALAASSGIQSELGL